MNTTLHISMDKTIKERPEAAVKKQEYSSLQEVLHVLVTSLAQEEIKTAFIHTEFTPQQERFLDQREEETRKSIQQGKAYVAHSVKEMMDILENTSHK